MPDNRDPQDLSKMLEFFAKHPEALQMMGGGTDRGEEMKERAHVTSSMEEVHDLIQGARRPLDRREVLEIIVKRLEEDPKCIGGDHADFHNSATEAFRSNLYDFGLKLLEAALVLYPGNPTLVGDKIQALKGIGDVNRAIRETLQFWKTCTGNTKKFASDWRVGAFFKTVVEQVDPSFEDPLPDELIQYLPQDFADTTPEVKWADVVEAVLNTVIRENPRHIRSWGELAEVRAARGDLEGAINTLLEGLKFNPFSQQLRFTLGELYLLLAEGPPQVAGGSVPKHEDAIDNAIRCLEEGLETDFQRQFQSDVNPFAVILRLAQAYEGKAVSHGDQDALLKAQSIYQEIEKAGEAEMPVGHFATYARNRLRLIRTYLLSSVILEEQPARVAYDPDLAP